MMRTWKKVLYDNQVNMFHINEISQKHLWKGIFAFLFFLLIFALIISWNTPAIGYESSIYYATPLILWLSISGSFIAATFFVILTIAKKELNKYQLWKVGIIIIYLIYVICLSLFIIRGYYMWCMTGDPASHIGWINETVKSGYIPTSLAYPFIHIFSSEIVIISGLDLVILHKFIPLFFGMLCIFFMYILGKTLFNYDDGAVLVAILSCCLTFGWYVNLTPNALSNLFIPFAFYLFIKFFQKRKGNFTTLFSIIIIVIPLFHILPSIVLVLVLLTYMIPLKMTELKQKINKNVKNFNREKVLRKFAYPLLLLITWMIFWFSSFWAYKFIIRNLYESSFLGVNNSKGTDFLDMITYAQGYGFSVIDLSLKNYGAVLILFILSIFSLRLIWKDAILKEKYKYLFPFFGPFFATILVMLLLFMYNLPFSPLRLMTYSSILGTIFSAFFFHFIFNKIKKEINNIPIVLMFTITIVTLIIFAIFILSVISLYPSPYNLETSYHTTKSELKGMSFIYDYRDTNIPITGITAAPGRFSHALLTPEQQLSQKIPLYFEDGRVPWHFGHNEPYSMFSSYIYETDLIITVRDRMIYEDIFPEMAAIRFTKQDFEKLKIVPNLITLYSNGEFDYMKIDAKNQVKL